MEQQKDEKTLSRYPYSFFNTDLGRFMQNDGDTGIHTSDSYDHIELFHCQFPDPRSQFTGYNYGNNCRYNSFGTYCDSPFSLYVFIPYSRKNTFTFDHSLTGDPGFCNSPLARYMAWLWNGQQGSYGFGNNFLSGNRKSSRRFQKL